MKLEVNWVVGERSALIGELGDGRCGVALLWCC